MRINTLLKLFSHVRKQMLMHDAPVLFTALFSFKVFSQVDGAVSPSFQLKKKKG